MHLKSNMDRFIDINYIKTTKSCIYLKSNMDRFIDDKLVLKKEFFEHLKSNMDRFIAKNFHYSAPISLI